jgi:hypothetical protein
MKERNSCSKTSCLASPPEVFMKKSLNPITHPPLLLQQRMAAESVRDALPSSAFNQSSI